MRKGKVVEKILENFVCGVIVGSIVSMVPCATLVIFFVLIPGWNRFYEHSITIVCPLATLLSIALFCYLDFIRKPGHSGTKDRDPRIYKLIGFVGEILGACFPIAVWFR